MDIKQIAEIIGAKYSGQSFEIKKINTLLDAQPSEISFVSNDKYVKDIYKTKAGALIVDGDNANKASSSAITLVVDEPYVAMAKLSKYFSSSIESSIDKKAVVGKGSIVSEKAELRNNVNIGKNCHIMANVYLGDNVVIKDNTILYPGVVIYRDCYIGSNCIVHANSVIGGDGFGFATSKTGQHIKIYQNGNVIIEDDVEIGSCTTIDRAALGSTLIKKGVHIDNLVQVAHNCEVGEYSVLVSQTGLAGSSKLGHHVVMGGQSATSGHLEIAPLTTLAARSGVTKSIKTSGKVFGGFPLMQQKSWLKLQAKLAKLLKT